MNHPAQKCRFFEIRTRVQAKRDLDFAVFVAFESQKMCRLDFGIGGICGDLRKVDSVPLQYFVEFQPIDRTEAVEPINGRDGPFIFDIGKAGQRDDELVIFSAIRNPETGVFNVPVTEIQPLPSLFQALAWVIHGLVRCLLSTWLQAFISSTLRSKLVASG